MNAGLFHSLSKNNGQWGTVLFEMDVTRKRHARMQDAIWKAIMDIRLNGINKTTQCGRPITPGTMTALPEYISPRYRKDIETQMGVEAKYYVPEHDRFEVYLCSQ